MELLEVINRNPDKPRYRVTGAAGLNIHRGNLLIEELLESGFITSRNKRRLDECYITITAKGIGWLQNIQQLLNMVHNGKNE